MLVDFTSPGTFESIQLVIYKIGSIPILQVGKEAERNRVCNFAKITLV